MSEHVAHPHELDDRDRDKSGKIRLKNGTTLNKNLSHPIAEFSETTKLSEMRKKTGEKGIEAIRKAAHGKKF